MATLREIRGRIAGVKKTQKITKAMKMVAAAKLRRAQTAVVSARPYAGKMKELLLHLSANPAAATNPFVAPREVGTVALVVVTADRGLCGAFNSNLIKAAVNHLKKNYRELMKEGKVRLFCVGRKGADFFTKQKYPLGGTYAGVFDKLSFATAPMVVRDIISGYESGQFDKVEIMYNEFKSAAQQRIVVEQFLPIAATTVAGVKPRVIDYLYEPSESVILDALLPRHLNFQLWRVLLESNASEQGARMVAMDNATENAKELIDTLQLSYNKARQASITKELLEIVGGANALQEAG